MAKVEWLPAPCSKNQLGYLQFLAGQLGMGPNALHEVVCHVLELDPNASEPVPRGHPLSQSEASRVIDCLKVTVKMKGGQVVGKRWATDLCSKEQREYIERLRMDRGMSYRELIEHFNVTDIGQLTKADASEAIEWLKR